MKFSFFLNFFLFLFTFLISGDKKFCLALRVKLENNFANSMEKERFPILTYDYEKFKLKFLKRFAYYDYSSANLKRIFVLDFFLNYLGNSKISLEFVKNIRCEDEKAKETIELYKNYYEFSYNKNCSNFFEKFSYLIFCDGDRNSYMRIEEEQNRKISITEYTCSSFMNECGNFYEENSKSSRTSDSESKCEKKLSKFIPPIGLIRNNFEIQNTNLSSNLNIYDEDCYSGFFDFDHQPYSSKFKYEKKDFLNQTFIEPYFKENLEIFKSHDVDTNKSYEKNKKLLVKYLIHSLFNKTHISEIDKKFVDDFKKIPFHLNFKFNSFLEKYFSLLIDYSIMKRDFILNPQNNLTEITSREIFLYFFKKFENFRKFEIFSKFLINKQGLLYKDEDIYFEVKFY